MRTNNLDGPATPNANMWRIAPVALLIAGGSLVSAAPAQPDPSLNCANFQIPPDGPMTFEQDNGLEVVIYGGGTQFTLARYSHPGQDDTTRGNASGYIYRGRSISINAIWTEGPGAGLSNIYEGSINDDGSAQGTTTNNLGTKNNWTTKYNRRFMCETPAADPAKKTATVLKDTGLYDKPDEMAQRIGSVSAGEVHPLMEPCKLHWCRIGQIELGGYPGLPNGTAWVDSTALTLS